MEDNDDMNIFNFHKSDENEIEEINLVYDQQPELKSSFSDLLLYVRFIFKNKFK
jgi:hypothetical protein